MSKKKFISNFSYIENHNVKIHLIIFLIFIYHSFEVTYDEPTKTLTISDSSDIDTIDGYMMQTEHLIIDGSITEIQSDLFHNWCLLESIIIRNSVTLINDRAFMSCSALKTVFIGSELKTIGTSAFNGCGDLENITIPDTVSSIGKYSFALCQSLKYFIFPEMLVSITSHTFYNCSSLPNISISNSITSIGDNAFQLCSNSEIVIIGENVTSIGSSAFESCSSLTSITIPDSVTAIGGYAFQSCSNLETVIIGGSVSIIGVYAFQFCNNLICIYFTGYDSPIFQNSEVFNGVPATYVMTSDLYRDTSFGPLVVTIVAVEGCDQYSWPTHTFTQSNAISSNTFTRSNTISTNIFSRSNSFTNSNTYICLASDESFSVSLVITFYKSVTQTLTIYNSIVINSYSIMNVNLSNTYIRTEFIYYQYKVITYFVYYSLFSYFYTIVNLQEFKANEDNTMTIVIICVVIVVLIIVVISVIVLIRIKNNKNITNTIEEKSEDVQNETSSLDMYSGVTLTNLEDDPFATDFKENLLKLFS